MVSISLGYSEGSVTFEAVDQNSVLEKKVPLQQAKRLVTSKRKREETASDPVQKPLDYLRKHIKESFNPTKAAHFNIDHFMSPFSSENINDVLRKQGTTLLHWIASDGHRLKAASRAVEIGADLNAQEKGGNSPLIWAVANGNHSMVKRLINLGKIKKANFNLQDFQVGNTAMHLLIAKGYRKITRDGAPLRYTGLELVQELIEVGADVNLRDRNGNTPLHLACLRRDEEACRLLIEHGARTDIQNEKGQIPADMLLFSFENSMKALEKQAVVFSLNREKFEDSAVVEKIRVLLKP